MHTPSNLASFGHMLTAVLTSCVYLTACALAVANALQIKHLHNTRELMNEQDTHWTERLPPVMTVERWLVRLLVIGFMLLSTLILTGMLFGEHVWGAPLKFNHKTLLTLIGWLLTAILLMGRRYRGWRGQTLVRYTLFSGTLLFLAYIGTHIVFDLILHRGA